MKHEAKFQTVFNHWLKKSFRKTAAFELKLTKTSSVPFSAVVPHQVQGLWHAKNKVLVYKIPDVGYQTPFDGVCLSGVPAYVVIKYPSFFCLIDIDDWINESKRSKRRSLIASRAEEIAVIVIHS